MNLRKRVVSYAEVSKGSRILDVGTGTGDQAFAFAKNGYTVVGIDISSTMLEKAKQKNSYGHVSFHVADATNLPFPANHFACTCVSFTLHEMPLQMIQDVLDEIVRVTIPHGTIMIVDFLPVKETLFGKAVHRFLRVFETQWFSNFLHVDLQLLLRNAGIEIKQQYPFLWGAGTILKGYLPSD